MAAAAARALAVRRAKKKQQEKDKILAKARLLTATQLDEEQKKRVLHELKSHPNTKFLHDLILGDSHSMLSQFIP